MKQTLGGRKSRWVRAIIAMIVSFIILLGALAVIPMVSPSTGAHVADVLRSLLGPQPVANIESVSFWIQDNVNQFISTRNGGKSR
jgi:hypothetical protein